MNTNPKTQTCAHCKKRFIPDHRNRYHQQFCGKPACRRASKHHSQQKWLVKNPGFFKGHEHVLRVQVWRHEKGRGRGRLIFKIVLELLIYRKKGLTDHVRIVKRDRKGHVLQDVCEVKDAISTRVIVRLVSALQDFIEELGSVSYFRRKTGKKTLKRRNQECRKQKTHRLACSKKSRNSTTRR